VHLKRDVVRKAASNGDASCRPEHIPCNVECLESSVLQEHGSQCLCRPIAHLVLACYQRVKRVIAVQAAHLQHATQIFII
jgi:hypothetical protein